VAWRPFIAAHEPNRRRVADRAAVPLNSLMHTKFGLSSFACLVFSGGLLAVLAACSTPPKPLYQTEQFDSKASPFARNFDATAAGTCQAARRALLSQGYMTTSTRFDLVDGSKNFQPDSDSHVTIEFHVVCTSDDADSPNSTAYVSAVQDRYTLKKSTTSASVGLSVLGSLSLPIGSSDDEMVKIASETIPAGVFYDRFFNLLKYYIATAPEKPAAVKPPPPPPMPEPVKPVKAPASGEPASAAPLAPGASAAVATTPVVPSSPATSALTATPAVSPAPVASASAATASVVPSQTPVASGTAAATSVAGTIEAPAHAEVPAHANGEAGNPAEHVGSAENQGTAEMASTMAAPAPAAPAPVMPAISPVPAPIPKLTLPPGTEDGASTPQDTPASPGSTTAASAASPASAAGQSN
jgi:hypothetical protein